MRNSLSKRERRCLLRIVNRKSIPDIGGMAILQERGMIKVLGHDDDPEDIEAGELRIDITAAGRAALEDQGQK
jgi:hypothetical protein